MTDLFDDHPAEHDPGPEAEPDELTDDTPLAWEGRVFAVALAWALPGVLLGLLVALFAPVPMSGSAAVGGFVGALTGGLLEADYWA